MKVLDRLRINKLIKKWQKFLGTIDELKEKASNYGLIGLWSKNDTIHKFVSNDGGVLSWYISNGTLLCQGKSPSKQKIEKFIAQIEPSITTNLISSEIKNEDQIVFIVYGHDETSREQLEFILNKLSIKHFVLSKTSGGGKTLIEALENQVGTDGKASAGIVLLTPDDLGYSKKEGESQIKNRARQNVILEMGMLLSKFSRQKTIILVKGNIERPSDTDGIIYLPFTNHVKECGIKLIERLEEADFEIDHKLKINAIK